MNTRPESIVRKERSHAILRARGVPLNVHLPGLESVSGSPRRDARTVARRALAERHYALNWLIGYRNQAWDDVSTDT
ncbi:MAG: DUF4272 domain-containing protein [bacterium]|nr:DUF4272 domain-containing protein [bacterium]